MGPLPEGFTVVGVARTPWSDEEFRQAAARRPSPTPAPAWTGVVERLPLRRRRVRATPTPSTACRRCWPTPTASYGTGGQPRLLPGHRARRCSAWWPRRWPSTAATRPGRAGPSPASSSRSPSAATSPAPARLDADAARGLRRGPDLPHRPLHGQGDGAERPGPALRQRHLRAHLEPPLRRAGPDHRGRELGVEHRGGFYETAGALRDIVQNHVMQVLALTLMEPPDRHRRRAHPRREGQAAAGRRRPDVDEAVDKSVRGQYAAGDDRRRGRPGLPRGGRGRPPTAAPRPTWPCGCAVDNWRWAGVPVYVRTGKRLPARVTEVALQFHGSRTWPSRASWPATCGPTR